MSDIQPECNCNAPWGHRHKSWCDALKTPGDDD